MDDACRMEEEDGGFDVAGTLAGIVCDQPAAPDDDYPEFNRIMERAMALSLQESLFDAYLREEDECKLHLGLQRSVAFAKAVDNEARERQRWFFCVRERDRLDRIQEAEEAQNTRKRRRRIVFEMEEKAVSDALSVAPPRVSSEAAAASSAASFANNVGIDVEVSGSSATY